jgi:hypothetical protein
MFNSLVLKMNSGAKRLRSSLSERGNVLVVVVVPYTLRVGGFYRP